MHLGGLSLFTRTNSKRSFNIAAYHSPHSLTWSWIVSISFDGIWRKPGGWLRVSISPYRTNDGRQWVVALPFVVVHRHVQRAIWFRDLFSKARDREDELEERNSKLRRDVTNLRARALASADEARPQ